MDERKETTEGQGNKGSSVGSHGVLYPVGTVQYHSVPEPSLMVEYRDGKYFVPREHGVAMDSTEAKEAVGDIASEKRGAGARFNSNKSQYHQLPLFALEGVVKVLMHGAKKYAPGNYLKGMAWSVVFDSLMRHLVAWQRGEDTDPESGEAHIDHALCNLIFLSAYRDVYPEGDDRWPGMRKGGVIDRVNSPMPNPA